MALLEESRGYDVHVSWRQYVRTHGLGSVEIITCGTKVCGEVGLVTMDKGGGTLASSGHGDTDIVEIWVRALQGEGILATVTVRAR